MMESKETRFSRKVDTYTSVHYPSTTAGARRQHLQEDSKTVQRVMTKETHDVKNPIPTVEVVTGKRRLEGVRRPLTKHVH